MITYDHLWWIKSTYDGWRRLKMLFWRKPALTPTKNYENKTVCVFFQGAFDGNVKISRNIARKSKNIEILNFLKIDFLKFFIFIRIDAPMYFLHVSDPGTPQKPDFWPIFKIFLFFMYYMILYRSGPRGPKTIFFKAQRAQTS